MYASAHFGHTLLSLSLCVFVCFNSPHVQKLAYSILRVCVCETDLCVCSDMMCNKCVVRL